MYISKLNIFGFKSFYKKSEIDFDRGITAIVGPNGCGKSNIVDAIRWVIGEQKPTVLRVDKGTDVIFNGTEKVKPLNLAEVSLVIHNESGKIPIALSDIVITRRMYRSGDSEYLINNHVCRLKDINDLFIDTGMGANAYSIMELKMVEEILSENPEERKQLFEEAAGVNKYRIQRKSALRKLEATENDLLRLSDIIQEVESKVRKLRSQLKKYEKYRDYTKKLIESEILLTSRKIIAIRSSIDPLKERLNSLIGDRDKLEVEISQNEEKLKEKEALLNSLENEHLQYIEDRNSIMENKSELEKELVLLREKLKNIELNIDRENNEMNSLRSEILKRKQENEVLSKKIQDVRKSIANNQSRHSIKEKDLEKLSNIYENLREKLTELKDKKFSLMRERSEIQERIKNLRENITTRENENKGIEERIIRDEEKLKNISSDVKRLSEKVAKLQNALGNYISAQNQERNRLDKLIKKEEILTKKLNQTKVEIESIREKIEFYDKLIENIGSDNELLNVLLKNQKGTSGFKGALFDLIDVDQGYRHLIEIVLGDIENIIVVKDLKNILNKINNIEDSLKGKVTILTEELVRKDKSKKVSDEFVPILNFIKSTPDASKVVSYIFGNIYIVNDDVFDKIASKAEYHGIGLLSKSGKYKRPDDSIIVTKGYKKENVLIGRKMVLNRLREKLDILKTRYDAQQSDLEEVVENKKNSQLVLKQIDSKIKEIDTKLKESRERLNKLHIENGKLTSSIDALNDSLMANKVAIDSFKSRLKKELEIIEEFDKKIKALEDEIIEKEQSFSEVSNEYENISNEISELKISLVNLKNDLENLERRFEVNKRFLSSSDDRLKEIIDRIEILNADKESIGKNIEERSALVEDVDGNFSKVQRDIKDIENKIRNIKEETSSINMRLYKFRHQRDRLIEEIKKTELEIRELESKENELRTVIREKYKREIDIDNINEDISVEQIERNIERYKRELEILGSINLSVEEEYKSESERLKFLKEQMNDLIKSGESLKNIIAEIDKVAREQYLSVFRKIQVNFEETFKAFFGGGTAELRLEGGDDPLESKVEIYACPRGKRLQSLKMLSAGEKALTAISLLFAIYQVKPSPFCVLDEVDAPLDDENIKRFANVIKTFSKNTQFIIVTHNKLTMNIADVLYGVTMPQHGISQIVSVKMK